MCYIQVITTNIWTLKSSVNQILVVEILYCGELSFKVATPLIM